MSNKFDADAYLNRWEPVIIPAMIAVIVVSLVLAVFLNVKTRPSCLRHELVYCGTESQANYDQGGHGEHAAGGHGEEAGHGAGHP